MLRDIFSVGLGVVSVKCIDLFCTLLCSTLTATLVHQYQLMLKNMNFVLDYAPELAFKTISSERWSDYIRIL